jgi:hypothetical protein
MEQKTVRQRLAPFLALMDGRFFPLLIVALPQAFVVYQWLEQGNHNYEGWATVFAVVGAAAFESVYLGVIAWAEGRADQRWVQGTTLASLGFSALVAVKVYWPGWQEELSSALLHAGFPLLAYCYSMTIHSALKGEAYCQANPSELEGVLMTVAGIDELKQEATEAVEAKYRPIIERGNQQLTELRYQLEQANQRLTAPDQEKTTLVARVAELETALEKAGAKTQSAVLQTEARLGEELSAVKARLEESEARSKRALENLVFPESAVSEILGAVFGRGGRRIKTDQALIEIKEAWLRAVSSVAQEEQAR